MTNRGLYIVIEGPEGVGKTTQVDLLANKLREQGRMVRIAREPDSQSELTARAIRRLTQDPRYPMNTKTEVLLYNAARSQSLEVIRKSTEAGIDCVVDRSFLTNLGIQYYGRGDIKDYETIDKIIKFAVGDMYPDVMLILDAPVDTLMERFEHRYHGERFDNLDRSFIERVRNGYLTEAEKRAIPVLDALKSTEELSDEILTHVTYARGTAVARRGAQDNSLVRDRVSEPKPVTRSQSTYWSVAKGLSTTSQITIFERQDPHPYHRPENLGKKVLTAYDTILNKIMNNHSEFVKDYSKHLAKMAVRNKKPFKVEKLKFKAAEMGRSLLPVSTLVDIESGVKLEEVPETVSEYSKTISKLLPNLGSEPPKIETKLVSHLPRNEFEILENMIFANSDQSEQSIKHLVDELSYEKKSTLLKDCLRQDISPPNVAYSFDVSSEFRQLFDLLRDIGGSSIIQSLTPRNGYDIPGEIEDAGLGGLYQQSFDLSLELYSLLQAAGFESQAQYAVLLGHRARCKVSLDYNQIKKLFISKSPGYKSLAKDIRQQAADVHPLVWSK